MKNVLINSVFLCSLFISACNTGINGNKTNDNDSTQKAERKISKRDISITKANAYNDLFLDSATVAAFIAQKKLPDSISLRMRSFYNARNYQFAWFSSDGLTEQARGFWNLIDYRTSNHHDSTLQDKALAKKMNNLIALEDPAFKASDKSTINTELTLTQYFVKYIYNTYDEGYVKRKEMERFVPRKKEEAMYLADSLLNKKHKDNKYFEDVNERYKQLKTQLARYYEIAKKGGWQPIKAADKIYKKGMTSPVVSSIKKRLQLSGDMPANDTSQVFDDTLVQAVESFQRSMGYTPTGLVTHILIKDMNVPVTERIQQILMNMGRMRWMPNEPSGSLIVVNIPEFVLHVYEGKKKAFDMNVVVGKDGHNTTMFTGDLNQIVFSPYWNVPQSIVENEIVPKMQSDPDYLTKNNMEVTGTEDGLPVVRQLPGPDNSLGRVKFLFPNSFNIYFHDTNAKSLFNQDKRAYSHGCIRLSQPEKMAEYLLRNQPEWTSEKIEDAMNSGKEQYVKLKKAVPVFITYYTAWVDDDGQLNFRDDIYGHDTTLSRKMFVNGL